MSQSLIDLSERDLSQDYPFQEILIKGDTSRTVSIDTTLTLDGIEIVFFITGTEGQEVSAGTLPNDSLPKVILSPRQAMSEMVLGDSIELAIDWIVFELHQKIEAQIIKDGVLCTLTLKSGRVMQATI